MEKFKTVKNNAKSENLKDIVKELERAIFGYDYDDDNEEPNEHNGRNTRNLYSPRKEKANN